MAFYDLRIKVEKLENDGDYHFMATSPDLPGLTVAGETEEEVLALAPQVASALIASMKAAGDPLPKRLRANSTLPSIAHITVAV